jgi:hypothetical protein
MKRREALAAIASLPILVMGDVPEPNGAMLKPLQPFVSVAYRVTEFHQREDGATVVTAMQFVSAEAVRL